MTVFTSYAFPDFTGGKSRTVPDRDFDAGVRLREFFPNARLDLAPVVLDDGLPHRLSDFYANLTAARVDFPLADEMTLEVAGLAMQRGVDYMFANRSPQRRFIMGAGRFRSSLPLYFDPPGNLRGGLTATKWTAGTYALGAVVTWNGVLWKSQANGNNQQPFLPRGLGDTDHFAGDIINWHRTYYRCLIDGSQWWSLLGSNPTPAPIFSSANWVVASAPLWLPTTAAPSVWNRGVFIEGDGGLPSSQSQIGCGIKFLFNNTVACWGTTGNGNRYDGFQIYGYPDSNEYGYRGGQPTTGVGLAIPGGNAGASRTEISRIEVTDFYRGIQTGTNQDALADSNLLSEVNIFNTYEAISFGQTQNFINSIYGSTPGGTRSVVSELGGGARIFGCNLSTGDGSAASGTYAIASVSAITSTNNGNSNNYDITVTLSAIDNLMKATGILNRANIVTSHFGVTAWDITSVNVGASTVTMRMRQPDASFYYPLMDAKTTTTLEAELQAATTLYCVEWVTPISGGGITVVGAHIENANAAGGLINSGSGFGDNRANDLDSIVYNYDPALAYWAPQVNPTAANLAKHYAAATNPIISIDNQDLTIRNSNLGLATSRCPVDFVTPSSRFSSQVMRSIKPNVRVGSNGGFSFYSDYGEINSPNMGGGEFDQNPHTSGHTADDQNLRTRGWMRSAYWGYRPAHDAVPAVSVAQYTTLTGTLPAITYQAGLFGGLGSTQGVNLVSGGTGYTAGDVLTLVGGTFSSAGQIGVYAVSSGVVTAWYTVTAGVYSVTPSSFTVTGGTGTGATFNQPEWNMIWIIGYPRLWGGRAYGVFDLLNTAPTVRGFGSAHIGHSLGQDLTTTNVPNLSWNYKGQSSFVYCNIELLQLLEAGDCVGLHNGTTYIYYMVTGVFMTLGYFTVAGTQSIGDTSRLSGVKTSTFTGALVKMPPFVIKPFAMVP